MVYILGIAGAGFGEPNAKSTVGHDPAAALIKDGKIICAVEEERLIRQKHATGHFPYKSIKFCLDYAGIDIEEVDYITSYINFELFRKNSLRRIDFSEGIKNWALWEKVYKRKYLNLVKRIAVHCKKDEAAGERILKKLRFVNHHDAHAASSFFTSGFEEAAILTIDGSGEGVCTTFSQGRGNSIKKLKEFYLPHTFGGFYSMFTEYLGFKPNNDEYKVMGLAPYGKPGIDMADLINVDEEKGEYTIESKCFGKFYRYSSWLEKRFGPARKPGEEMTQHHKDLAYALQDLLQQSVLKLVKYLMRKTGSRKLCIAGGVGMNTKLSGFLQRQDFIDDLFVNPSPGDNGTSFGSALWLYYQLTGSNGKRYLFDDPYLGPEYSDDEIEIALKQAKAKYKKIDDPSMEAAKLVAQGKIIGWFQGRLEWGARALGARSIIADPRDPNMKDKVNAAIKFREAFRPFCPSMLYEAKEDYFEHPYDSPFMTLTFICKEEKRSEIPSVVHVDGTVRPQLVKKESNEKYYRMIEEFSKISSVPLVMNTSFNVRGEPVVCTPRDALRTFFCCGLDCLIIGDFLVSK